MLFNFKFCQLK